MANQTSLAMRLRLERARRGLSLSKVAAAAGVDRHSLGRIERGEQGATIPTLKKLADYYDLPVEELVEMEGEVVGSGKGSAPESGAQPRLTQAIQDAGGIPSQEAFGAPELINIKVETDRLEWVLSAIEQGQLSAQQGKNLLLVDSSD